MTGSDDGTIEDTFGIKGEDGPSETRWRAALSSSAGRRRPSNRRGR